MATPVPSPTPASGSRNLPWLLGGLLLLLALSLVLHHWPAASGPDPTALLERQHGDSWYRVTLAGEDAGWAHMATDAGQLQTRTILRFRMPGPDRPRWHRSTETLRFSNSPPHRLEQLDVVRSRGPFEERISLQRQGQRYRSTVVQHGEQRSNWLELDWTLADQLALERWLQGQPDAGSRTTTPHLDTSSLQRRQRQWLHSGTIADGQVLTADSGATLVLDAALQPTAMALGQGLALHRSSRQQALAAAATLPLRDRVPAAQQQLASNRAGLDRALGDPAAITRLELELNPMALAAFADAPGQRRRGVAGLLVDRSLPDAVRPEADELGQALAASPAYPVQHPGIQAIAGRINNRHDSTGQRIAALTALVHNSLVYDTRVNPLTVLDTLATGRGDCTEFAELFTTLARAAGLPTRTVTGLAYLGDSARAFGMHAWNEVWTGQRWQVVDPTWNQPEADATHLRFEPGADTFAVPAMAFRVAAVQRRAAAVRHTPTSATAAGR